MILVTGDTHGTIDYEKIHNLNKKSILGKNDYLIIAGDFGGVWNKNTLENDLSYYTKLPFNVLFVDGNHENFDLLNSYPVTIWNGGKVHIIKNNIIHLMRGQIYNIDGKTIFTLGGGTSIDKYRRIEHISWWKEEIPSEEEILEAKENLIKYNNKVDYIITHSCDTYTLNNPKLYYNGNKCEAFTDNMILDYFEENIDYKHWYFGHYHIDATITEKKTALYRLFSEL
ncbi:MAG: metallophosphoesterase [Anaeroplasmataceae bacterium]